VVESRIGKRVGRSLKTTLAHGGTKAAKARKATFFFIEGQTLYFATDPLFRHPFSSELWTPFFLTLYFTFASKVDLRVNYRWNA
jgi:hypothetical protein